jgi:signal transduction histidine kinase/CheY-like chemotaxis protein
MPVPKKQSISFADLCDLAAVERMLRDFHAATGWAIGIVDTHGTIIVQVGYRRICTHFHRANPGTERRCIESDLHISRALRRGAYTHYTCANGLIDAASPIVIDGEHLATIYTGQFFFEQPCEERFRQQAREFDLPEREYLEALREVPVVTPEQYHAVMGFLTNLAQMLGELGLSLKRQKEAESALLHAQKMEAVGRLAGGVAHDLNNMLQSVLGYVELVRRDTHLAAGQQEMLDYALESGDRARRLIRQLLAFSRKGDIQPEFVSLRAVLDSLRRLLAHTLGDNITLATHIRAAHDVVFADAGQIEQALLNLCVNARDAMPQGGRIEVSLESVGPEADIVSRHAGTMEGDYVCVRVRDTGVGIPDDQLGRIFEPFFTTKEQGKGTGLGLATAYAIAKRHQGTLTVESHVGVGSTFSLYLPARGDVPARPRTREDLQAPAQGSGTLLLAEDDAMARHLAERVLVSAGYTITAVSNGAEAVEAIRRNGCQYDLLVLDVLMPGRNGRDVHEYAKSLRPDVPVLFCSAYSNELLKEEYMLDLPHGRLLQKPYTIRALLAEVQRLLEGDAARASGMREPSAGTV